MARRYVGNSADPSTPDEFADAVYNGTHGVTPEMRDKFRDAYVSRMVADGSLEQQIATQTQMALASFLKDNKYSGPPVAVAPAGRSARSAAMYNKHAPGAAVDEVFSSAAELFQSVSWRSAHDSGAQRRLARATEIQNSFSSEVPDAGGFLVPETLRSEILMLALEDSIVRPRATVIPMSTLRVPVPTIDDTSHVSSVFGGVTYTWAEEAAALSESQAAFGRVVLDAKKLTGYFNVPNELLADAPAFSEFFNTVIPKGLAWQEDVAFLNGTGVGEPMGIISCEASVSVAKESGQSSGTILWENIVKMYSRMLPQSLRKAVWIANNDTFPELATMALSVGTGGGPVWIGNFAGGTGGADTPPMTILGRPVYFTEKVPTIGTTGDIIFADLSFVLVGDRQSMQLSSSQHYRFANDQTSFRIIERVDSRPWLQSALTPHSNSSNLLSAFVQLATR
jgi:HK97 family phage major capsid protein